MSATKLPTTRLPRRFRLYAFLFSVLVLLLAQSLFAQEPKAPADIFSSALAQLKQQTHLPILLPDHLPPLAQSSVYARASVDNDSYSVRIESDPDCNGANACFLGIFRAKRNGHLSYPVTLNLTTKTGKPVAARYKATTCGGSCSSPSIEWKSNGVLYTVQLTLHTKSEQQARTVMTDLAQESISAGPR
jgi:hypothetical protein